VGHWIVVNWTLEQCFLAKGLSQKSSVVAEPEAKHPLLWRELAKAPYSKISSCFYSTASAARLDPCTVFRLRQRMRRSVEAARGG